jgi:acyl-coenzyme A thioesterase 13
MENQEIHPALLMLQSQIGKEMRNTPSPFGNWLGAKALKVERGALEFEYTVRREMTNPAGTLHGGVIAAIMDDIMGATMFSLGETHFKITVNLNVDYFYPAREGEKITARSWVVKEGKMMFNAACELFHENGKLMARGSSNLIESNIPLAPGA